MIDFLLELAPHFTTLWFVVVYVGFKSEDRMRTERKIVDELHAFGYRIRALEKKHGIKVPDIHRTKLDELIEEEKGFKIRDEDDFVVKMSINGKKLNSDETEEKLKDIFSGRKDE